MEEINLEGLTPAVRKLNDMREVLRDDDFAKNAPDEDLYFMYRKVKQENGLIHNITVIPAKMLGSEFIKTAGHVHMGPQQEIYTVLEGEALFLMQKGDENEITDCYVVKAKKGESAVIPSLYGHVTINPANTDLKTGDWSSETTKADYSLFKNNKGACYYYVKDAASAEGFGEPKWVKNENYKNVPELRFEDSLKSVPEDLSFLK
ncbi:MAG: glucose-6-phosphate isomerase [Candidatus Staskawiczbacteria bacterium]|nr:glucose-6-phosphate isomerase [Candidatus Staskawiczbacteria bacterium]